MFQPIEHDTSTQLGPTLVQLIEVWLPADDSLTLHRSSLTVLQPIAGTDSAEGRSAFLDGVENSERNVRPGEGPAGMAWHQRRAILLQESPSKFLQSLGQRHGFELQAIVAIPTFCGPDIRGVVVLGLTQGCGAAEIWSRDDRDELSVSAAWYQGLPTLELISRYVRFPKGAGLPGHVWKTGLPRVVRDLATNPHFMRSCHQDTADLTTGLGLPVGESAGHADSVLLLLSDRSTPFARQMEVWQPDMAAAPADGNASAMPHAFRMAERRSQLRPVLSAPVVSPQPQEDGSAGPQEEEAHDWRATHIHHCWETRQPHLAKDCSTSIDFSLPRTEPPDAPDAPQAQMRHALCLPLFRMREPAAVIVLTF